MKKLQKHPLTKAYEDMKLTAAQAAKLLDVHPMTIYFWEHGTVKPNTENFKKIKETFGVTADQMLGI